MGKGSCYCGKIRFQFEGQPRPVTYCHCARCRKFSGHFVAASSGENVQIEGAVKWYESSPGYQRGFCPECGTQMFWRDEANNHLSIMAGAFDDDVELIAKDHIFVGEKANYYELTDDLPKYQEGKLLLRKG